ncbi:hypothetical protein PG996_001460 [Apiospora saccharicola]|uniref:DUF4440 domain-containing protein n=1 Tax=Apiospora saccharicola TaxID=335842 RepID=A0ABR1WGP4_9PEZI
MADNGKQDHEVLAAVTGFLDSFSDKPTPLTETRNFVLPSTYAVDWRAHAGELIQTTQNEWLAEMERRLDRMRDAGLSSFVQALAATTDDLPPPRVWIDAEQGIAAVWAGFVMRSNGEEKYRGVGAFTLYRSSKEEEEEGGGGGGAGWKIAAYVDARWDPEYFRPQPTDEKQATDELLAAARAFTDLVNSGTEGSEDAALGSVLPNCITHRLDDKNGLQSALLEDLLREENILTEGTGRRIRKVEVLDGEGRVVAGVGFLWMHYTVVTASGETGAGQTTARGTATLTFLQRNEKWLVSGMQEAERLPL